MLRCGNPSSTSGRFPAATQGKQHPTCLQSQNNQAPAFPELLGTRSLSENASGAVCVGASPSSGHRPALSCPKTQVLSSLPALKKTAEPLLFPILCLCSQLEQISAPVGEAGVAPKGTPRLSSPPQGWVSGDAGCAPSRGWAVALAPGSGAGFGFWGWIWLPGDATCIPALGAPPKAGVVTPPARRGARGRVAGQILGVTIAPHLRANFSSPQ